MSDRRKELPRTEPADRSRLLILGSLGAAAATGGCFSSGTSYPQRSSREGAGSRVSGSQQPTTWRYSTRRQPAVPPQMTTPTGEGGGGGGGGGSH